MHTLRVILLSCATLLLPGIASAQSATLEICNNGRLDIDVAVAARIQSFVTGYTWKTRGWYTVAAGTCQTVYDEDYDAAGPYTPQSGARVAFTVIRSDGVWGAYHDDRVQANGWMRSGTGQICVNHGDAFTYQEAAGDPAANCKGILIPVAHDFMPDGAGKFTYTMDWDGYGSFVAVEKGGQPRSSVASSSASDSVDNSLSAQFLRALAQSMKDANTKRAATADTAASSTEKDRAALLGWVREDIASYLEASRTGFDSYKSTEVAPAPDFAGQRVWKSSVQPALAQGCWVVQATTTRTFMCLIPESTLTTARDYYTQITDDVTASLPDGWSAVDEAPFTGDLPSRSYRSSGGAHSEFWLAHAPDGAAYELHFQLIVPASATQAAKPSDDDDPIGEGGFITPPTPPSPPAPPSR
jgi:hypothetical protein